MKRNQAKAVEEGKLFWRNVVDELTYQGIDKKNLAISVGISETVIAKGLSEGHLPRVDIALDIAVFLDVSVTFLMGRGDNETISNLGDYNVHDFHRHQPLIHKLQKFNKEQLILAENLIDAVDKSLSTTNNQK